MIFFGEKKKKKKEKGKGKKDNILQHFSCLSFISVDSLPFRSVIMSDEEYDKFLDSVDDYEIEKLEEEAQKLETAKNVQAFPVFPPHLCTSAQSGQAWGGLLKKMQAPVEEEEAPPANGEASEPPQAPGYLHASTPRATSLNTSPSSSRRTREPMKA